MKELMMNMPMMLVLTVGAYLLGVWVRRKSGISMLHLDDKYRHFVGEGNGNPLQYSCPGKSHGQRSLAGCSL